MKKTHKKNRKQDAPMLDQEKLYRIKDLCNVDLKGKMEIMAGFAQELLRLGRETVFLAAVPKGDSFFFLPTQVFSEDHKIALQNQVIEWARENGADCLISACTAWASPHHPHLRPSVNPERKEILAVVAKDHCNHIGAMQEIRRHGKKVSFGEVQYSDTVQSWLDDYNFDQQRQYGDRFRTLS